MKIIIFAILFSLLLIGCTDATVSKMGGFGDEFKIELVNCDGSVTHSWISSGKVLSEEKSDGYYFNEKGTNNLVEVTGTLIITKQ